MDQGFILLEHQQGGRVSRLPAWAGPPLVGRDSSGAAKRIMDGRFFRPSCRAGQIRLFRVILRKVIASRPRRTPGPPQPGCSALGQPGIAAARLRRQGDLRE